ncbi:MAG: vitamin K epoxide reductase, partial [Chloroflexi bacterium]|nr:vitamin K epoxide reductase [Chloroflexota bacterium]
MSILVLASLLIHSPVQAQTSVAVVHAVLFYSPSCGHCHYVIEEVFPPLFEKYGDQLQIVGVDVTQTEG